MDAQSLLERIRPHWRAAVAPVIGESFFDSFVANNREVIVGLLDRWLRGELMPKRATPADPAPVPKAAPAAEPRPTVAPQARPPEPVLLVDRVDPVEAWTKAERTKANLEALQVLAMGGGASSADRMKLLGYSGWGGLSIQENLEKFPPALVPEDFGLIHEYYTPKRVADAVAGLLCPLLPTLGVAGKVRALEPSAGIGRLVRALSQKDCGAEIEWVAVEFSHVSARMLAAIRPDIEVQHSTFERWVREHGPKNMGRFNLIVSNPPYGERGPAAMEDPEPGYRESQSYAYFMRRSMDLLAPLGLGVFLVPAGLMTGARNKELRRKLLLKNHLVAAYRLPSIHAGKTLFPGANLVIDCVLLRSRGGALADVDEADQGILEGRYFQEFPAHVLGKETGKDAGDDDQVRGPSAANRRWRYSVEGEFRGLPELVERPMCQACIIRPSAPTSTPRRGTSVVRSTDVDLGGLDAMTAALVQLGMRVDAFLAAFAAKDAERAAMLWPELHAALTSLKASPAIAAVGGNPHKHKDLLAAAKSGLVGAQRLLAAFDPLSGELIRPLKTQPVFEKKYEGPSGDVVAQAEWLYKSRRRLTVAELVAFHLEVGGGTPAADIVPIMLGAKWCLDGERWDELLPSVDYYSGDLWPRYDRARARSEPEAAEQARALIELIRPMVFEDLDDISPQSSWVSPELVAGWLADTINQRFGFVPLHRVQGLIMPASVASYESLETAPVLSEEARWALGWMNHDRTEFSPKGKKEEGETRDHLRLRVAKEWQASFRTWVSAVEERRTFLTNAYNRLFRGRIEPTYSQEPLEIARWGPDAPRLHPWQVAGARRVLANRGGLIAFDVGVGKTFTALAIVARARQEGWVKRPVIITPTSIVWQWFRQIQRVLPDYRVGVVGSKLKKLQRGPRVERAAKLLAEKKISEADYQRMITTSETDTPAERAATWTALQAGLLDVVLVTYDALPRTRVNLDEVIKYADAKANIQRLLTLRRRNAKRAAKKKKAAESLSEREQAILKHSTAKWVVEQLELPKSWEYDPGIAWDDIGVDLAVIDESASFKNLYLPEPREFGIPKFMGNPGDGSNRAWQLDFRCAAIRRRTGGSGIVLLSATPAKNSPLEFYNLIQYIDGEAFSRIGIADHEHFIDRYLKIEPREVLESTLQAEIRSAVVGFKNLEELRSIIFRYGEFRTAKEVGLQLPEPKVQLVEVDMDERQEGKYGPMVESIEEAVREAATSGPGAMQGILGELARLALIAVHADLDEGYTWQTAITGGLVRKKIPFTSLVNWTSRGWTYLEGAAAAEEKDDEDDEAEKKRPMATIERDLPRPDPNAPKFQAVADRIMLNRACGHIVFVDSVVAHRWLVEVLVARGIPRERIAVINASATQGAQDRLSVAQGFNGDPEAGTLPIYDVVIANKTAYEGIDLQTRTCAIHHIDLTWTPADLEQRNGRGYRQGNQLAAIAIYYYLSRRSMDGFRYQQVTGKVTWLGDLMATGIRETNNPGAQADLSPRDTLLMLSRDPEQTRKLFEEVEKIKEEERRKKEAENATRILARCNARFRDAREEADPVEAARLRAEGEALLEELQRVRPEAWPWAPWTLKVREQEYFVPPDGSCPVYEGLRVGQQHAVVRDNLNFYEFGRLLRQKDGSVLVPVRAAGSEAWTPYDQAQIVGLKIMPDDLKRGATWPGDDDARTDLAIGTGVERLTRSGLLSWERLRWTGASEAWLSKWWPRFQERFVRGLELSYRSEDVYPQEHGGVLLLGKRDLLGQGRLLPPTLEGWREYLRLAPQTEYTFGELAKIADWWWARTFPRGYLTRARQESTEEVKEEEEAPRASTGARPTAGKGMADPDPGAGPGLTDARQDGAGPPPAAAPALTDARQDGAPVGIGHVYRIGGRWYGDTAFITALGSRHEVRHAGFGDFDAKVPGGQIRINRSGDRQLVPEQSGRLHDLADSRGDAALEALIGELALEGRARVVGRWDSWDALPPPPPPPPPPAPTFDMDSPRDEVLAALRKAGEQLHTWATQGEWERLETYQGRGEEAARRAFAWARHNEQLTSQLRARKREQVEGVLARMLAPDSRRAYFAKVAAAFERHRDYPGLKDALDTIVAEAREALAIGEAKAPGEPPRPAKKPPPPASKSRSKAKAPPRPATTYTAPEARAPEADDMAAEFFGREFPWKLHLIRPFGAFGNGRDATYVVHAEDRSPEDAVLAVDVDGEMTITDVRWVDDRVRPGEQRRILARLEQALAHAAEGEDTSLTSADPFRRDLDARTQGLRRTKGSIDVGLEDLYRVTADLAEPTGMSPAEVRDWLLEEGFGSAADTLAGYIEDPSLGLERLVVRLWEQILETFSTAELARDAEGALVVPVGAIHSVYRPHVYAAVRDANGRQQIRRVDLPPECDGTDDCALRSPPAPLAAGMLVLLEDGDEGEVFAKIGERLAELEDSLRRAPTQLADVRRLLELAGKLVDTVGCRGDQRAQALKALAQAKALYDAARQQLVDGRRAVAVERIRSAMQRISIAAAKLAESCAEGQPSIFEDTLTVDPGDARVVRGEAGEP